jgi:hypothetical protein
MIVRDISDESARTVRVFVVCLTAWAISTQVMVFDYLKYDARVDLLNRTSRLLTPGLAPSHLSDNSEHL